MAFGTAELCPANRLTLQPDERAANLATLRRTSSTALVNHYSVQPVFDVYANVDRRDLGAAARAFYRRGVDIGSG